MPDQPLRRWGKSCAWPSGAIDKKIQLLNNAPFCRQVITTYASDRSAQSSEAMSDGVSRYFKEMALSKQPTAPAKKRIRFKIWHFVLTGALGGTSYILLFTAIGNFIIAILFGLISTVLGSIGRETLCDIGNWRLETFQPLISDAEMLEHFKTHQTQIQTAVDLHVKITVIDGGQDWPTTPEFDAALKAAGIKRITESWDWGSNVYTSENVTSFHKCINAIPKSLSFEEGRVERVQSCSRDVHGTKFLFGARRLELNFGRILEFPHCKSIRGSSTKAYFYFPGSIPKITHGYLLGPVSQTGAASWTSPVVASTDYIYRKTSFRQINDRWYIVR